MSTQPIQLVSGYRATVGKREYLWIQAGKKCHWCGCATRLVNDNAWDKATVDHVIPRYKGGTNDPSNLVSACNRCNNRRNHEDHMGLPEGSLLGQFKTGSTMQSSQPKIKNIRRITLTADDKKKILESHAAKVAASGLPPNNDLEKALNIVSSQLSEIQVLRMQRDSVLQTVIELRREMKHKDATLLSIEQKMKAMTVWGLIRQRVGNWLLT